MRKFMSVLSFLLTTVAFVGMAYAQKGGPGGGGGVSGPEPSMILYAVSGVLPAWYILRRK